MGEFRQRTMAEMAEAASQADSGVPGHSERVTCYAVKIAEEMGLHSDEISLIRQAAALHDIGKIALSEDIVGKLGRLTDTEFEVMKMHSTIGLALIENSTELRESAPLVRHHHERWDGKGYPDGLKGEEIPVGARIIGVCEAYDTMVSTVPWQVSKSPQEALDELRRCSGTQFDSNVVEAFYRSVLGGTTKDESRAAA